MKVTITTDEGEILDMLQIECESTMKNCNKLRDYIERKFEVKEDYE